MNIKTGKAMGGNTLIVVVVFTGILSILLVSNLNMVNSSNVLTARSLSWNNALPVAEAGVEEAASALATLSYGQSMSAMLQTNGWAVPGNTLTKTRQLTNAYFSVLITSTNTALPVGPTNPPVICSTGYVMGPLQSAYIGRVVRVTTKYNNVWCYGLLAKTAITVNGAGSTFDSFDPTNPSLSTGGLYDPLKYDDQAHVGCYSGLPGCVSVGSAKIYGDVNTQFGGSTTVGGSGVVGDKNYVNSGGNNGTIEMGHSFNNLNAVFFDAQVPFASGATLSSGTVGGTSYQYVAGGTNYYFSGDMTLANPMLVTGKAIIYVTGSFNINGGGSLTIAPNASLTMVIGGPSCSINGGGIINASGLAANCSFQCLPSCTSGVYGGGATFVGTINAPEADWTLNGGAGVCGALAAQSFKLTGGMCVHYDESLGRPPSGSLYSIASWKEL